MKVASKPTTQKDPLADSSGQPGQRSEKESVLLALSTALAGIRERKELFAAIFEQINPIIPVDDTGLIVLNQTGENWQDWTNVDNYQNAPASTQLQQMGYDRLQPMDRWMEYTLHHTGIMTVARFMELYPEHPFGPVMWAAGLREMLFTPLLHRGKTLGVLFLDSRREGTYTETHLPLFQAVTNLIAVAVANILANEEILQREREKSVLLSISEAVATIRDKQDLLKVVFEKVQPLFSFYDTGFFVLDPQGEYIEDWSVTFREVSPSAANLQLQASGAGKIRYAGSAIEWAIGRLKAAAGPQIFPYNEAIFSQYPDYPQFEVLKRIGYQESLAALLRTDGREMGLLLFNSLTADHFQASQFTLFQAVADQLAVAVANILANEEILRTRTGEGFAIKSKRRHGYHPGPG
jgi:GAF domain-containing protein